MHFKLNLNITEKDYLDYNLFWNLKSPYGKKQVTITRILISVFICFIAFLSLAFGYFSAESFLGMIPYLILLALWQFLLTPLVTLTVKFQLKSLKKAGKMGYTPLAEMEFYENEFIEISPESKSEVKYSFIERVSIVENLAIYLHINNLAAAILPFSCFDSKEQYESFLAFIKTKCANIDTY